MKHLLALALGPVQDFIAAARSVSDLTAGSQLLVDIAKATTRAIEREAGQDALIFPANSANDGPNKILVELPEGKDPKTVADAAKAAAKGELGKAWQAAKSQIKEKYDLNTLLADAQIECFLEIYAAWVSFPGDYPTARKQADALLAGRKNLLDFESLPLNQASPMRGKSPLDPAFACVLYQMPEPRREREKETESQEARRNPLHLSRTEFLDAVSLLKRVHGQKLGRKGGGVPSTRDLARGTKPGDYQGDWSEEDDKTPEPYPYFAILQADGDRMGALLGKIAEIERHKEFSEVLSAFAALAKGIITKHDGYPIYTGGDDVLAFLPVKTAVACAQELAEKFAADMATFATDIKATLSAGVAIVHYRQPLSLSLDAARTAERVAKDSGRDALCLALHTRGGQPLFVNQKWEEWKEFKTWTEAFAKGNLTRGVAYELGKLAKEFEEVSVPAELLQKEAERIWKRKESKGKQPDFPPEAGQTPETLKAFADLLVAARFLTEKEEK